MILFSLILPTYKVEKYIAACIESCCNQVGISPDEYEIIIVNDGTPDNSIEEARKVFPKYPNHKFKVVNRVNGGLSAARNSGLASVQGEYIWFIDSDDYIHTDALAVLSNAVVLGDFDIVNFTHNTVYKDNRIKSNSQDFNGYKITGVDYLSKTKFLSAWTCIYKRKFLEENRLFFKEGVIWEDSEFNLRAYTLTKNCYCISNALYYYIRREDSISDLKATSFSTRSRISNVFGLDDYFSKIVIPKHHQGVVYSQIASQLVAAIAGLPELESSERKRFRKDIRKRMKSYFNIVIKCGNVRDKMILICFYIFPEFSEMYINKKIHEAIKRSTT